MYLYIMYIMHYTLKLKKKSLIWKEETIKEREKKPKQSNTQWEGIFINTEKDINALPINLGTKLSEECCMYRKHKNLYKSILK